MEVKAFFDKTTYTVTYLIYDTQTKDSFLIDPILNYDATTHSISTKSIDILDNFIKSNDLKLHYIIDTHAHADHLSGAYLLKQKYPESRTVVNKNITLVQKTFKEIFNITKLEADGSQFDILTEDGQILNAGSFKIKTIFTPGHTPACTSYLVNDCLFTGDSLFMPDFGTGRCDFPKGSAKDLYNSIKHKIYTLPDKTKIFVGHDYGTSSRDISWETTIKKSKESNIQLNAQTSEEDFIKFRTERDKTLKEPKLIYESIQVNIDAGKLPEKEDNGGVFFKLPIYFKDWGSI